MSQSSRSVKEQLSRVWDEYFLILQMNSDILEDNPDVAARIGFRMESAKFYISQLEFWGRTGDMQRFEEIADQARKSLEDVYQLIDAFIERYEDDEDMSEE
jgi:hypothetical protein